MKVTLRGESLNWIVQQHPTLFYPQNWYVCEAFAGKSHEGTFDCGTADAPAAAFAAAFAWAYEGEGKLLWADDWCLTNDRDHNGDRVYVGKPAQYGGFQIHRRLQGEP